MTWGHAPDLVATIRSMMLDSREAFVRYTMPLGLHHLIGGDHYAPMPENPDPRRADWSAIYYHRADASGRRLRSDATRQRRRRSVFRAASRSVERSGDDARRAAAVVSPAAVDLSAEIGPHPVGRAGAVTTRAARNEARQLETRWTIAPRRRSTTSATRPCSRSSNARRRRRRLARQVSRATSRRSARARCRFYRMPLSRVE